MGELAAMFSLKGKTALVTGATKGIGQCIALGLAEAGADIISLQRDITATATQTQVQNVGQSFTIVECDISSRESVQHVVQEVFHFSSVDILVNCAGLQRRRPAEELSYTDFDDVLDTNLKGTFSTCKEVGCRWLNDGKNGVIINVASLAAMQGGINMSAYAASKGGVLQLTRALSNEWAGKGIRVNCLSPGYIKTDINKDTRSKPELKANYDFITARIPMGVWGEPEHFKGVAVFMASDASNYMSGENIVIDGGFMAR